MLTPAIAFLNGIAPLSTPYLEATSDVEREVWAAVATRAARVLEQARTQ